MKASIITTISNEVNKFKFTMDSVMLQSYKYYENSTQTLFDSEHFWFFRFYNCLFNGSFYGYIL